MKIKKYALLVLLAGAATVCSLILLFIMSGGSIAHPMEYPNKQGFEQAVIWFEIIRSPDEVQQVLGDPSTSEGIALRRVVDTINTYDFIFMICYPLLFAALIVFVHAILINKGYRVPYGRMLIIIGLVLSAIMLLGDAYENVQLFKISAYKNISDIKPEIITTLQVATRIKNVPIFLSSLILTYLYILYFRKSLGILLPGIYCVSALLGFVAISVGSARFLIEAAYSISFVAWLISIVHGGIWYVRSRKDASLA